MNHVEDEQVKRNLIYLDLLNLISRLLFVAMGCYWFQIMIEFH